jgi:hypothetical protein
MRGNEQRDWMVEKKRANRLIQKLRYFRSILGICADEVPKLNILCPRPNHFALIAVSPSTLYYPQTGSYLRHKSRPP